MLAKNSCHFSKSHPVGPPGQNIQPRKKAELYKADVEDTDFFSFHFLFPPIALTFDNCIKCCKLNSIYDRPDYIMQDAVDPLQR